MDGIVRLYAGPEHVLAYDDGEARQQFSICFRAHPADGSLRTSTKPKGDRWIDPPDLDALGIHPPTRLRIQHGLDETRHEPSIG
ncbi:hypothetical protein [Streptomyces murinus]|uniref:hypothetical protein n=1 Tax=Streptomyces murinus TaxID=33900 RepID=UPI003FD86447